ncbi:MAG: thymidine phosphorylase [Clostridia bacterium]|nr:thymidine phosphorylase [Clostridia bacterium]
MRIYDIIAKKRDGYELTDEEIAFFVRELTKENIKDYQATALLMAIYIRGMSDREMITLTKEMAVSGDTLSLSELGITADKHSTGGVGDKTTLIVAPIVASLGINVAKMSGRGLGHTGGTVDKLESIEGFRVSLSADEFISQVKSIGIAVVGQTGQLAPADKIIYSLRDATATVGSVPLIASSIMSKKLAAGSETIVLDVKYGSGAFMKTTADAETLSRKMVDIGKAAGRKLAAVISDMGTPLGKCIGNSLEVKEAIEVLKGNGSEDLKEVCLTLAANIVSLSLGTDTAAAREMAEKALANGSAYEKFKELILSQGGNVSQIESPDKLPKASTVYKVLAPESGYIAEMQAEIIGSASVILGAGRLTKEDSIDYAAGIILHKKTGDKVTAGEAIAELHTNDDSKIKDAERLFLSALYFSNKKPEKPPLIYKVIK